MPGGTIYKYHDDLDTDQIIASQYLLLPDIDEMKVHTFESLDPDFPEKVKEGDFVVGGENFGCGSSREQAPSVLKALGVRAVIAKSFARIFYRNSINIGLPVIVCKELPDEVKTGDTMELSRWICPSMNPGHIYRPVMSTFSSPSYSPIPAMYPSSMAISATSVFSVKTFTIVPCFRTRDAFFLPEDTSIIFFKFPKRCTEIPPFLFLSPN